MDFDVFKSTVMDEFINGDSLASEFDEEEHTYLMVYRVNGQWKYMDWNPLTHVVRRYRV